MMQSYARSLFINHLIAKVTVQVINLSVYSQSDKTSRVSVSLNNASYSYGLACVLLLHSFFSLVTNRFRDAFDRHCVSVGR